MAADDMMVDKLISLTSSGTMENVRIEAVKSLLHYRHLPKVQKCLIGLTSSGTMENVRIAAVQVLGGRLPE